MPPIRRFYGPGFISKLKGCANLMTKGLVDTAVKTAETGYMARRLMKVCPVAKCLQ